MLEKHTEHACADHEHAQPRGFDKVLGPMRCQGRSEGLRLPSGSCCGSGGHVVAITSSRCGNACNRSSYSRRFAGIKPRARVISCADMSRASSARHTLLASNAELLEQAAAVLLEISDEDYCRPAAIFGGQRIGGHVRHVVEFYECLFAGLAAAVVDYDARRRDPEVENDRRTGRARLLTLASRLESDSTLHH